MSTRSVQAQVPPEETEQDKLLDMGGGISRTLTLIPSYKDKDSDELVEKERPVEPPEVISTDEWVDRPVIKNQAEQHPNTCRETGRVARVLDMSIPDHVDTWNDWLVAVREQRAIIHDHDRNFYEGKYFIYAVCSFLEYKRIAPTRKDDGQTS